MSKFEPLWNWIEETMVDRTGSDDSVTGAVSWGIGVQFIIQAIKRRNMLRVDSDIILLGLYYILVILAYLVFEMVPINYYFIVR